MPISDTLFYSNLNLIYAMAPTKKRKSEPEHNEISTDEEKAATASSESSKKRARLTASATNGSAAAGSKLKFDLAWQEYGQSTCDDAKLKPLFYLHSKTLPGCTKIAGFDIDMTIIKTKSGKTFATGTCTPTHSHSLF